MSRGDRSGPSALKLTLILLAVAAIIAAFVGLTVYQESRYRHIASERAEQYAQDADSQVYRSCITSASEAEKSVCMYQKSAEAQLQKRDNERNEADLVAQRKSALWTGVMGLAAIIGMALSIVGVYLVWTTFRATREANDIARDTAKRQLRAYVGIDGICVDLRSNELGYDPAALLKPGTPFADFLAVTLKNFGQTPAASVTCYAFFVGVEPFAARLPDDYNLEGRIDNPPNWISKGYLETGKSDFTKIPILDARPFWKAMRKECSLYIYGRVYYVDAFEQTRSTRFCYVWEPWHHGGPRFVPSDRHNGEDESRDPHVI